MKNLHPYKSILTWSRIQRWIEIIFFIFLPSFFALLFIVTKYQDNFTPKILYAMLVIACLTAPVAIWSIYSIRLLEKRSPPIWACLRDTSHTGDLIDLLDITQVSTNACIEELFQLRTLHPISFQVAVRSQLVHLLPTVQPSDTRYLNANHRRRLNQVLTGDDTELILAVLVALKTLGDRTALPSLQRLAAGKGSLKGNRAIQNRAQHCIVTLQQRLAQESTCETLLRPSASATPPATLLRPSSGTIQVAPEEEAQLLRPTQAQ